MYILFKIERPENLSSNLGFASIGRGYFPGQEKKVEDLQYPLIAACWGNLITVY